MGDGKKVARAETRAMIAETSRQRMYDAAVRLAAEVRRLSLLVTMNRLLCLAALAGWAWAIWKR